MLGSSTVEALEAILTVNSRREFIFSDPNVIISLLFFAVSVFTRNKTLPHHFVAFA